MPPGKEADVANVVGMADVTDATQPASGTCTSAPGQSPSRYIAFKSDALPRVRSR